MRRFVESMAVAVDESSSPDNDVCFSRQHWETLWVIESLYSGKAKARLVNKYLSFLSAACALPPLKCSVNFPIQHCRFSIGGGVTSLKASYLSMSATTQGKYQQTTMSATVILESIATVGIDPPFEKN